MLLSRLTRAKACTSEVATASRLASDYVEGCVGHSTQATACNPQIRRGAAVPDGLNLCTLNPGGYIESDDGARIAFDGKGYGLRSPDRYRVSMTMAFRTEDARYGWLNRVLGVMTGDFDEKTGRADWRVYVPGQ